MSYYKCLTITQKLECIIWIELGREELNSEDDRRSSSRISSENNAKFRVKLLEIIFSHNLEVVMKKKKVTQMTLNIQIVVV